MPAPLEFTKLQQVAFAQRMRRFRSERGLSRQQLADMLGVSVVRVAQAEGAFRPTVEIVLKFGALEERMRQVAQVETRPDWSR